MFIFLLANALAYPLEEHRLITKDAFLRLKNCGLNVDELQQEEIIIQNLQEDSNLLLKWSQYSHYYNPTRPLGIRRSSSMDRLNNLSADQQHSGVITHHLQDLTLPLHVIPINHTWKDGLEGLSIQLPSGETDCDYLIQKSTISYQELMQQVAEETIAIVRTNNITSRDGIEIPLSAFWQESDAKYGSYTSENTFGNPTVYWNDTEHIISPEQYVQFKQTLLERAIQITAVILYKDLYQESSMTFQLYRDSSNSVLDEIRSFGIQQDDFVTVYPARNPTSETTVLKVCKDITINDHPLLYLDEQGIFVHGKYFTTLNAVSPDQFWPKGDKIKIGTMTESIPFEVLIRFLIQSDIILTYVHIGSEMTIQISDHNRAEIRGTHTYYTNEENNDPFAFAIEVNDAGDIYILKLD